MSNAKLKIAGLLASIALISCDEQQTLLDVARQADVTPTCYGLAATIYPGHPGNGTIVPNGAGWTITGTSNNDVIVGGPNDDVISGGGRTDRICAGGGNDVLLGEADKDFLNGEDGEDWVSYATSPAAVTVNLATGKGLGGDAELDRYLNIENATGSAWDDLLRAGSAAAVLEGLDGNDRLFGGVGDDTLLGGAGVDIVNGGPGADDLDGGAGNDDMIGGAGADAIDGGGDTDRTNYLISAGGVTVPLDGTGTGSDAAGDTHENVENILGSNHNDVLTGNSASNFIDSRDGDDVINGEGGADVLKGGLGVDEMHGGADNDLMHASDGDDQMFGDDGDDRLFGQVGNDDIEGGNGNDDLRPGLGTNSADGGAGTDQVDTESCTDTYISIEVYHNSRCAETASTSTSLIGAAHSELAADGVSTTTITVQLRDANSNNLTLGGPTVVLSTDAGLLSNGGAGATSVTAIDQGNGTYTATLTASTTLTTATVTSTIDTNPMTANVQVDFVEGALHHFVVTGTDGTPIGQQAAGSAFNIKIVAQDAQNHTVTAYTGTVDLISTPGGSLGSSGTFVEGVLASQSVTLASGDNYTITATKPGSTESGTSNSFLVTSLPGAVADANSGTSSPGEKYHTALNTELEVVDEEQILLDNDNLGFPAATITHFGAVRCNNGDGTGTLAAATDAATANAAGAPASLNGKGGCTGGSLQVNADGTLTFTPANNYTGLISFQYRIANSGGNSDGTVTLAVGERPAATNSTYGGNVLGNVPINTGVGSGIQVDATGDRLSFNVTGETNGDATVATNKTYTFTPAPGYSGAASFTFTAANGFGTSAGATVDMTVGTVVWFVDASASAGGNGSYTSPVNCVVGTNCLDDVANDANDVIHIAEGTYNSSGQLVLKDGQKLIGEGTNAAFSSATGLTWTSDMGDEPATGLTAPTLHTSTGNVLTLGNTNTIRGLVLGNAQAGSAALGGSSFGTLTVNQDVSINTSAAGLSLANGTISGNLGGLTSGSTDISVFLSGVTGTSDFGTGTLAGRFAVSGGAPNITYAGNISNGSASPNVSVGSGTATLYLSGALTRTAGAGALLSVSGGHTTGTVTLAGQITASSGTGLQFDNADGTYNLNNVQLGSALAGGDAGIDITNGSGGTFTFGSNLAITSPSGTAFTANGSTANVTYSGNITQGTASQRLLDITNESAGTITFQTGTLSATNGTGLLFSNADGTVNLNGTTTLNGGDAGVDVNNGTSGTINIANGSGSASIGATTAPTGIAFDVDGSATTVTGGITYGGTIRQTNAANIVRVQNVSGGSVTLTGNLTCNTSCTGLNVSGNTGGTITFSGGTKTLNTGANAAVSLSRNNGATIAFTNGNLALTTTTGRGFDADSGATLSVTGADNTISTSGAATHALRLDSVVVAGGGIGFTSVNAGATTSTAGVHIYKATTGPIALGTVTVGGGAAGMNLSTNSSAITATPTINAVSGVGIQLTGNTGSVTLSAGAIGNTDDPAGNALDVSGGNAGVTIAGNITKNTGAARIVNVANRTGGTVDVQGVLNCTSACTGINVSGNTGGTTQFTNAVKTLSTGGSNAITLSGNTNAATIAFTGGGLAIATVAGKGLAGTGAGIVNVTGDNNTISNTGTGPAVELIGTGASHFGAGTIDFETINKSGGGTKGIVVNYFDGSFMVSGDDNNNGVPDGATAGGTISGTSARGTDFKNVPTVYLGGMTFTNTVSGNGGTAAQCGTDLIGNNNTMCNAAIHMDSITTSATIRSVTVTGSVQTGINGFSVRALTLNGVSVSGAGASGTEAEHGVALKNLLGTSTITGSTFTANYGRGLSVTQTVTEGTVPTLNITSSVFSNSSSLQGAFFESHNGGNIVVNVGDDTPAGSNTFSGNWSNALQQSIGAGSQMTFNVKRNTINHTVSGIIVQAAGAGGSQGTLTYNLWNNTVVKSNGTTANGSGAIIASGTQNHRMTGDIRGNTIGNANIGSGAFCGGACNGITVDQNDISNGGGGQNVTIIGNTIQHVDGTAISAGFGANSKSNVTITGNLLQNPDNSVNGNGVNTFAGIYAHIISNGNANTCLAATIGGGTVTGSWPSLTAGAPNRLVGAWGGPGDFGIFVWQRLSATFKLPGFSGGATAWVQGRNSFSGVTNPAFAGSTFGNGASCP